MIFPSAKLKKACTDIGNIFIIRKKNVSGVPFSSAGKSRGYYNTVSFSRKMAKLTLFARGSNFPLEYSRASSESNRITSVSLGDTCSCKVMPREKVK